MVAAVMERVGTVLQAGDFTAVASLLDEAELCSPSATVLEEDWPAALHLLAHVYNGNLPDARLLFRRLPETVKTDSQVEAAWRLLQFAWQGSGEGVWRALSGYPWRGPALALAEALGERLRSRQLDLVAAAYSHIGPARLAALCGCSEEEAVARAAARGWRAAEDGSGVLEVVPPPAVRGELDNQAALEQLSEYMMQLE
ncbi:COP9 signalosome complex subunit 8 [Tetrabaena socialis]|uniref:COP9 signalosome complex subunit 8 n=1 Tax=Tetrabaena socialis TaxID=47790 RepID=A0A2J7ZHQ0_9CHLO|nr:COP9 signalosome complex subunit 8 [Tetrabaena socialis]|eukprot:PNG99796.1 COP9 signalosome complex subunit 8 [Tetrabaena socialis]